MLECWQGRKRVAGDARFSAATQRISETPGEKNQSHLRNRGKATGTSTWSVAVPDFALPGAIRCPSPRSESRSSSSFCNSSGVTPPEPSEVDQIVGLVCRAFEPFSTNSTGKSIETDQSTFTIWHFREGSVKWLISSRDEGGRGKEAGDPALPVLSTQ